MFPLLLVTYHKNEITSSKFGSIFRRFKVSVSDCEPRAIMPGHPGEGGVALRNC